RMHGLHLAGRRPEEPGGIHHHVDALQPRAPVGGRVVAREVHRRTRRLDDAVPGLAQGADKVPPDEAAGAEEEDVHGSRRRNPRGPGRSNLEMDTIDWFRRALFSGSVASVTSTVALAACGRRELASAATPLNGPSQWVLGTHAPWRD